MKGFDFMDLNVFAEALNSPFFGIAITVLAFEFGIIVYAKTKSPFLSPFIVALFSVMGFLILFDIPISSYRAGGDILNIMVIPATSALAISMYNKLHILKKNIICILISTFMGALSSIVTIYILAKIFKLDESLTMGILPKSVTIPIALDLSIKTGGVAPITISCVAISGVLGALLSVTLIKIFKIDNPVAKGLAMGTSGHGVSTAKAIELGETEGALAGIAIGMAGAMTVLIYNFIY